METPENVNQFLDILSNNLKGRAQQDFDSMLEMKKSEVPYAKILSIWDPPYFTQKAKKDWMTVAASEYSPYFSLGACMEGFNLLLQSIYGISLQHEEMQPGIYCI